VQFLMADVAEGLRYLHALRIATRDIKPENIVYASEGNNTQLDMRDRAIIIDFTIAMEIPRDNLDLKISDKDGSPYFMAPEC
jgi:serine/threonine protein kinase